MKALVALIFLSLNAKASVLCEVYGISDSPQTLVCAFGDEKMKLTCRKGTYFLDDEAVEVAFHLEVEEGPTPLVFRTQSGELTVTMLDGRRHDATFSRDGKKMSGSCRL